MTPMVIGVGNRSRGDDGVGLVVVDKLAADPRAAGIETAAVTGDLSGLGLRWTPCDDVIVVDAMVSGRPPGTVVSADWFRATPGGSAPPLSSHGLGLADAVSLARRLDRLPRSLLVVAVEGADFDHERPLSPAVRDAADEVVDLVLRVTARTRP